MIETFVIVMPLMLSPGPANLVSFAMAARLGLRPILGFQLGIVLMYTAIALLLGFLSHQLTTQSMLAAAALQVAGGIFIIYLGYSLASRPAQGESTLPAPNILSGMLLQLLNPKYPAVVLAVCAARPSQHIAVTVAAIVGVGAIGLLCYGTLGATFRSLFTADKYLRTADVVFGVLLALVGLWIAAQPFLQI